VSDSAPLEFVRTPPPEEAARANFYGLLARLFYAPPDAALLQALAGSEELDDEGGGIALAWRDLAAAAAKADSGAVREEYETIFIGTGKAPVTLYTSAYTVRFTNEIPLAGLRAELAAMGLARRSEASEPEDHLAALCDVMRHLITQRSEDIAGQKRFFERWIWPATAPLCDAIDTAKDVAFYRPVARFAKSFLGLEHSAFEML
jgi:TorA maturation chaperone TorD